MISINNKNHAIIHFCLLFLASIATLSLVVDLKVVYHTQQPLFLLDFHYLMKSLGEPGGFTRYFSQFIVEMFDFGFIGAFLTAILCFAIPFLIAENLKQQINTFTFVFITSIALLTAILLVSIYQFKFETLVVLVFALLFNKVNIKISEFKNTIFGSFALVFSHLIAFIILGGWGFLFTVVIFSISILASKKPNKSILSIVGSTVAYALIPFIMVKVIYSTTALKHAYFSSFLFDDHYKTPVLYFFLIGFLATIPVILSNQVRFPNNKWMSTLFSAIVIAAIIILPNHTQQTQEKKEFEIDYHAYNKNWDEVISIYKNHLHNNQLANFHANRALFFKNKGMLNHLFTVDQNFRIGGLLLEQAVNRKILTNTSDVYYDLGIINESRHWAHEAFTSLGYQPRILKQMTACNIINGKYNTAKKYIDLLKKSPANKKWALTQELIITNSKTIKDFPEFAQKRNNIPKSDYFMNRHMPLQNLLNLLSQPGSHKMAFEYIIAYYLFEHNVIKVLNYVPVFREYNYKELPTMVQEALVLYMFKTQTKRLNLSGYSIKNENFKRFNEYSKLYTLYINHDKSAKKKLDKEFADSFWYYIHFTSPITKSKKQ